MNETHSGCCPDELSPLHPHGNVTGYFSIIKKLFCLKRQKEVLSGEKQLTVVVWNYNVIIINNDN